MSILIRGIEMPKRCEECRFYGVDCDAGCWLEKQFVIRKFKQAKPDWCPLVEVPTPHGRLVDADELLKRKGDAYDSRGHLLYAVGTGSIVTAPTIIEAEE